MKLTSFAVRRFWTTCCQYQCCLPPLASAVFAVAMCYVVGTLVCSMAVEQVVCDLLVALGAVVVHFAVLEFFRRFRRRSRLKR